MHFYVSTLQETALRGISKAKNKAHRICFSSRGRNNFAFYFRAKKHGILHFALVSSCVLRQHTFTARCIFLL